jgi:tripeptidyl-peptidase-1
MKSVFSLLWAVLLTPSSLVFPRPEVAYNFQLKESVNPPNGWQRLSAAPADHIIHLRIGLPQSRFDELEKHLYEVSDPYHPRYGQHLSKAEVDALVAPKKESLDLVDEWLASFGIEEKDCHRSSAKDWVTIKVPISVAEKMLNTVGACLFIEYPRVLKPIRKIRNIIYGNSGRQMTTSSELRTTAFRMI